MYIDHVALYTEDLERLRSFYQTYFGAASNKKYHNPSTGLETYFLSFENGARLEIMTRPGLAPQSGAPQRMGYIHLAFSLQGKDEVDRLTARLSADGFTVLSGPRTTGDGYYESCVLDPDGNQIEFVG